MVMAIRCCGDACRNLFVLCATGLLKPDRYAVQFGQENVLTLMLPTEVGIVKICMKDGVEDHNRCAHSSSSSS